MEMLWRKVLILVLVLTGVGFYVDYSFLQCSLCSGYTKDNLNSTLARLGRIVTADINDFNNTAIDGKWGSEEFDSKASREVFNRHFPVIKNERYLIYTCTLASLCGGWGDRLRGLYSAYVLSVVLNRTFFISITKPCPIQMFIRPATLNWTVSPQALINKTVGYAPWSRLLDKKAPPLTAKEILSVMPTSDVVSVTINENYVDAFKTDEISRDKLTFLQGMNTSDIYRVIYHGLFQYVDKFEQEIEEFFEKNVKDYQLVGAHIRLGDKGTRILGEDMSKIWQFLQRYRNNDTYRIFIASDTQHVKDEARKLFGNQYLGISGTITHTDYPQYRSRNECDGLKLSLFDHAVLSRSHILFLTNSGFGIEAAHVRHTSDNLFCFTKSKFVIPCRRQQLKVLYNR